MWGAVSKSGSPISRWTTVRPCASRARALASTSKADSVPSRDWRAATVGMAFLLGIGGASERGGSETGALESRVEVRGQAGDAVRDLFGQLRAVERGCDLRNDGEEAKRDEDEGGDDGRLEQTGNDAERVVDDHEWGEHEPDGGEGAEDDLDGDGGHDLREREQGEEAECVGEHVWHVERLRDSASGNGSAERSDGECDGDGDET